MPSITLKMDFGLGKGFASIQGIASPIQLLTLLRKLETSLAAVQDELEAMLPIRVPDEDDDGEVLDRTLQAGADILLFPAAIEDKPA